MRDTCHWRVIYSVTLILTLVSHDDVAYSAKSLEPTPSAIKTAANKQHYDDNDQKSCGVHIVLLLGDKRGPRGQGIPKDQNQHFTKAVAPSRETPPQLSPQSKASLALVHFVTSRDGVLFHSVVSRATSLAEVRAQEVY